MSNLVFDLSVLHLRTFLGNGDKIFHRSFFFFFAKDITSRDLCRKKMIFKSRKHIPHIQLGNVT